jgi:S-adenosylmethionine uptake transporter
VAVSPVPIAAPVSTAWRGLAMATLSYVFFASQDAIVKFLGATYKIPEILFFRCIVIILVAAAMTHLRREPSFLKSPAKGLLLMRSSFILLAWFCYYTAAQRLQLAEMTTIYFAAPIIVVLLSVVVLKEKVGVDRWLAVLTGFAGVAVAMNPSHRVDFVPAGLVLIAACCWATTAIMVRKMSTTTTSLNQMMASSVIFIVACGAMLPAVWQMPAWGDLALMGLLGLVGATAQFMLYEGYRFAPASLVAPSEYTMLIWATGYGYLIWHDWPTTDTMIGAALIASSGLWLVRRKKG